MFTVKIDTDNAAFDEALSYELARILRDLADKAERGTLDYHQGIVWDVNGNNVGEYQFA